MGGVGKTALVLAGGGSYGAVQVGMLRALCENGVRPDFVTGSSVGAINGAFYAGAPDLAGIARLEAVWRTLRRRDVFPIRLAQLLRALGSADHLFDPRGLRRLLTAHLPFRLLEQSVLPMHAVATDLLTGAAVCLSAGPVVEAVLASCAIPGIYPPVRYGDRQLIDGAVACNTPIRTAVGLGATRLIVLPTAFACPHAAPPRGVFGTALHAMDLIVTQQLVQDTALYATHAEVIMVPPHCPLAAPRYDFSHVEELIDEAARSTRRWLESGGLRDRERPVMAQARSGANVATPARRLLPAREMGCGAGLPSCPDRGCLAGDQRNSWTKP